MNGEVATSSELAPAELARRAEPRVRRDAPIPGTWFRRRIGLRAAWTEVWQFRGLVASLAERDLRSRYKQALLGFAWALVTPLMLMLAFSLVFTKFKINSQGVPYSLFVYVGLLPWTFFFSSVSTGGMSLVNNMPIVNKIYCPRELFPFASIVVAAVDTLMSSVVLGVLFAINGYAPRFESVYVPVLVLVLVEFTLGVTLLVSVLLVYFRDLRHALPLLLQFGLFATPVAYGIDAIAKARTLRLVYSFLNPLGPVIDGLRRGVLLGRAPEWSALGAGALGATIVFILGYMLFKKLETGIADIA